MIPSCLPFLWIAVAASPETARCRSQYAGDNISNEEWVKVARYYEVSGKHDQAGDVWAKCGHYDAALRSYIKGGSSSLDKAIAMVSRCGSCRPGWERRH